MARIDDPPERLTEYERAVCYYTLPRVVHPLTFGLMGVYAVCLLESFAILLYGVLSERENATAMGAYAIAAVVVMGIVTFTLRALLNEMRYRWALAGVQRLAEAAAGVMETLSEGEIPDPFAGHILIRRPLPAPGDSFTCTDNMGCVLYFVEGTVEQNAWRVMDDAKQDIFRVEIEAGVRSFSMGGLPARLSVRSGSEEVARVVRRFSLASPRVRIRCSPPCAERYTIIQNGIYHGGALVGRIYELHRSLYLDIEKTAFHEALLGLFVTLS